MEKEAGLLKKEIKICLPVYKIAYSVLFGILLALVRGVSDVRMIGLAIIPYSSFLAVVFCADTYEIEYREKRWEIMALLPDRNKGKAVRRRIWIQMCYLLVISCLTYVCFYWQSPRNIAEDSQLALFGIYILAAGAILTFWALLGITIVNLINNLWAGIGIVGILWLFLYSKAGEAVLGSFNVFSYTFQFYEGKNTGNLSWVTGIIVACLLSAVMYACIPYGIRTKR